MSDHHKSHVDEVVGGVSEPSSGAHAIGRTLRVMLISLCVILLCIVGLFAFDMYEQGFDSFVVDGQTVEDVEPAFDPASIDESSSYEQVDAGYDELTAHALDELDNADGSKAALLNVANSYFNWGMALIDRTSNASQVEYVQSLFKKSYEYYGEYLKISSTPAVEVNSAIALFYSGDSKEAIQALEDIANEYQEYAPAWSNLGLFYESEGRLDDAKHAYEQACQSTSNETGVEEAQTFAQGRLDSLDD